MRWSKIVHRLESLFHPTVVGRLRVHLTTYTHSAGAHGRGWITLDGVELFAVGGATPGSSEGSQIRQQFYETVVRYPDYPLSHHLASSDPLTRLLILADRRTGKKRITELQIAGTLTEEEQQIALIRGVEFVGRR